MKTADLLEQFVLEARECLQTIGHRLLDVERDPGNEALLNDLFREVHTLKGNCGLFDFKPLERIVHAGEDLLDRVRQARLAYNDRIADALLEAMDYTGELVEAIGTVGRLPAGADERATVLAAALRSHLDDGVCAPAAAPANSPARAPADASRAPPAWAGRVPAAQRGADLVACRYVPEPECFFKGEDPWHLVRSAPGLRFVDTVPARPWPDGEGFDCYHCNLDVVLVCAAPRAEVQEHFRYVPEQVEYWDADAATGAATASDLEAAGSATPAAAIGQRLSHLWAEQRALLEQPGLADATVAAVRCTLERLLACREDAAAVGRARASLPALAQDAAALAAWAAANAPGAVPSGRAAGVPVQERRAGDAGAPGADEPGTERAPRVLRVSQEKIDRLMELIGEMVVAKNALPYLAARAEQVFGQRELSREIRTQYSVINRIAEEMQNAVMQVRMMPVGTVFQRFGRLVRDIGRKLGKEVRLVVEGEDTEADKNVIEALADPLIHILRNSLDHGIELPEVRQAAGKPPAGTLRVSARQEGDRVQLEIGDDGAGIDIERVRAKAVERGLITAERAAALGEHEAAQLVFLPGLSTADSVSDLSGRGVGMDVVRSAVERINGTVELTTARGQGTTIRLSLPLSMAVTHVMMIDAARRRFGVPMDLIVETVRVPAGDIHHFKQASTVVLRGRIVPLRGLGELLGLDEPPRPNADGELAVLVVRHGNENVGLIVDDFDGTSDIILKPLEGVLGGITGFAGTALLGDGSVLMILNPKELL